MRFFAFLSICLLGFGAAFADGGALERVLCEVRKEGRGSFEKELVLLLTELKEKGVVERVDRDEKLRPLFVTAEGLIEEALSRELEEGALVKVNGAIHTPMPATPLCTEGEISKKLVHELLEGDRERLSTVTFRTAVMRSYLQRGGKLFVVYPKGGLEGRTEEQQKVYRALLKRFPEHLVDHSFDGTLPTPLIGATYVATGGKGEKTLFSIAARQANAPEDGVTWKLWYGDLNNNGSCSQRFKAIDCLCDGCLSH